MIVDSAEFRFEEDIVDFVEKLGQHVASCLVDGPAIRVEPLPAWERELVVGHIVPPRVGWDILALNVGANGSFKALCCWVPILVRENSNL